MHGIVSGIQRFSTQDGPGIRTTVFLKGCNLNCFWCHNPECVKSKIELQVFSNKCISCMKCVEVCSKGVHSFEHGIRKLYRENCKACGKCVNICPSKALQLSGEKFGVEELIKKIDRDSPFYRLNGGGVTFSGGEPLMQKDYLKAVLLECRRKGYNTTLESAFNVPWESIKDINSLVDLFIIDIKTTDEYIHKSTTGVGNNLIMENIRKMDCLGTEMWIRTPIIPGVNDNLNSVLSISGFVKKLKNVKKLELIPFHKLALNKYNSLGMEYKAWNLEIPSQELMEKLNKILK